MTGMSDSIEMVDLQKRNLVPLDFVLTRQEDPDNFILGLEDLVAMPTTPSFALSLRLWDREHQRSFTIDLHALVADRPGSLGRREIGLFSEHSQLDPGEREFLERLGVLEPLG